MFSIIASITKSEDLIDSSGGWEEVEKMVMRDSIDEMY